LEVRKTAGGIESVPIGQGNSRAYKIRPAFGRHDPTVSIDDLDLQTRMEAAERADSTLDRLIA
jgi:hypothetical protein